MTFSNEQTEVLNKYTKKLIKNLIVPTITPILAQYESSLTEVFIEPKVVSYLAVKNISEGDFSFLICTYNLYQYKADGKKYPFVTTESGLLNRGSVVSAISVSYKDTKILFGETIKEQHVEENLTKETVSNDPENISSDVEDKSENKELPTPNEQNNVLIQDEIVNYVTEVLENITNVKVKDKKYIIKGINQKPVEKVIPIKTVLLDWRMSIDKTIINRIFPEVYKALLDEVIKDKKEDNFYILDIKETELVYKNNSWKVLYTVHVTDAKKNAIVLKTYLKLDTSITYFNEKYKEPMEDLLNKKTQNFIKTSRTQKIDRTSLSFKPFARLTNETESLKSDAEQTKYVFERVAAIFEKYKDEKLIKNVVQKDGLLLVEAVSKKYHENVKLLIGGEGFYLEGYAYTRKGLEKAGDKKFATDYLHNQLGFNILWADLVSCYDFRKNVSKEDMK